MAENPQGLSKNHIKILVFIEEFIDINGYPPSIRAIGEGTKISTTSVVNFYLAQLESWGYLDYSQRISGGSFLAFRSIAGFVTRRPLKVFICYSSNDEKNVKGLYTRLKRIPWLELWLDRERLLPGQEWDLEITSAIRESDAIVICLSSNSITKEGYVQREIKLALDTALEKPEGTIFIIPVRLEMCMVPKKLNAWQYVDYFPVEQINNAFLSILKSLKVRAESLDL